MNTTGDEYGHLSAEEIWRISQLAEANAPVWSKQAWGAWRLGNSLEIKNTQMSETGRFGFDAAEAKGHLGEALGTAVAKIRVHMTGYSGSAGELTSAMERVADNRGTTHTELEGLWTKYEAAPDADSRKKIEQRMRIAYGRFAQGFNEEASGFKQFEPYSGVRKRVDGSHHNTDRLGGGGQSDGGGTGRLGSSGPEQFGGTHATGHPTGSGSEVGPELQATTPTTATPTPAPSTVLHTPSQVAVPPVIGTRPGGPAVFGRPQPNPAPMPKDLTKPVIHGTQPATAPRPGPGTPAATRPPGTGTPSRPLGTGTPTSSRPTGATPQGGAARGAAKPATPPARQPDKPAAPRFRREGGVRATVSPKTAPQERKPKAKPEPKPNDGSGDEEFWTMSATVVPGVIRSSNLDPYRGTDTGPLVFQPVPEAGPEPAPVETEKPSSDDWEPRTGTVPGVIGSRDRTAAQLRGGGEHDPGTVAGRDGMRQREPRVYFDNSDGEDER